MGMSVDPVDPKMGRPMTDRPGSTRPDPPVEWWVDPVGQNRGISDLPLPVPKSRENKCTTHQVP